MIKAADLLATWFVSEFRTRTQRRNENLHWALPGTRINSQEVVAKADELGIPEAKDGLLFRLWFQDVFERKLRTRCNNICVEEGDARTLGKMNPATRAELQEYRRAVARESATAKTKKPASAQTSAQNTTTPATSTRTPSAVQQGIGGGFCRKCGGALSLLSAGGDGPMCDCG